MRRKRRGTQLARVLAAHDTEMATLLRDTGPREPVAVIELYACGCANMHDTHGTHPAYCGPVHDAALWESMERRVSERWGPLG
jgi:hypothetical protein